MEEREGEEGKEEEGGTETIEQKSCLTLRVSQNVGTRKSRNNEEKGQSPQIAAIKQRGNWLMRKENICQDSYSQE
jgi:hypothetical protein